MTVDIRQRPEEFSARLSRHRIPYPSRNTSKSSSRSGQKYSKKWFEVCFLSLFLLISVLESICTHLNETRVANGF